LGASACEKTGSISRNADKQIWSAAKPGADGMKVIDVNTMLRIMNRVNTVGCDGEVKGRIRGLIAAANKKPEGQRILTLTGLDSTGHLMWS
jgi:hypothetical protein